MVGERSFFASFHPSLRTDSLPAGKSGGLSFSNESKKGKKQNLQSLEQQVIRAF